MISTLGSLTVTLGKVLKRSDDFLKAKHNLLAQFDSIDDLVTDDKMLSAKDRQAIEHHILQLRAAIALSRSRCSGAINSPPSLHAATKAKSSSICLSCAASLARASASACKPATSSRAKG